MCERRSGDNPASSTTDTVRLLFGAVDVGALDEAEVQRLTDQLRHHERALSGFKVRIGQRANQLSRAGRSGDALDTFLGRGQVSAGQARKEAARAEVAEELPRLGDALSDGRVSGEHLDAVARATKDLDSGTKASLEAAEHELVDAAGRMPVDTFNRHLRSRIDELRQDHGEERLKQQRARSEFKSWTAPDGMGHFRGSLDPERFSILSTVIDQQARALAAAAGERVTIDANLRAAALVEALSTTGDGRSRARAHLHLLVDAKTALEGPHERTVCRTTDGVDLPPVVADRFACDATIQKVVLDDNHLPINVGRRYRTATEAQWAAIAAAHQTCAWPGCDRRLSWCQAHHIRYWERGGTTDLDNLVPLCSAHHHRVHDDGWCVSLRPDRSLAVRPPGRRSGRPPDDDRRRRVGESPQIE